MLTLLLFLAPVVAAPSPDARAPSRAGASSDQTLALREAAPATPLAETYSYQPEGRRDPFISVVGTGTEPRLPGKRADGAAGLTVAEISVRGVLQSRGTLLAMVQGPDKKTYVVHAGDKLMDGTIKSITSQGLIIVQDVNDPLSLVKQREVRKPLRSLEDSKQ